MCVCVCVCVCGVRGLVKTFVNNLFALFFKLRQETTLSTGAIRTPSTTREVACLPWVAISNAYGRLVAEQSLTWWPKGSNDLQHSTLSLLGLDRCGSIRSIGRSSQISGVTNKCLTLFYLNDFRRRWPRVNCVKIAILLHGKTKCKQNRFMSCHKFDRGNEKHCKKFGTRVRWNNNLVRWHHSNDILNLDI